MIKVTNHKANYRKIYGPCVIRNVLFSGGVGREVHMREGNLSKPVSSSPIDTRFGIAEQFNGVKQMLL